MKRAEIKKEILTDFEGTVNIQNKYNLSIYIYYIKKYRKIK